MCKLIELILQPFVQKTSSYLKDSQDLMIKTKNLVLPNTKVYLYSIDFESLYTNIDTEKLLSKITNFISPHLSNSIHITVLGFYEILKLILENNIFAFKNEFFIQILGIIMGAICGPSLANIYVWILEKN